MAPLKDFNVEPKTEEGACVRTDSRYSRAHWRTTSRTACPSAPEEQHVASSPVVGHHVSPPSTWTGRGKPLLPGVPVPHDRLLFHLAVRKWSAALHVGLLYHERRAVWHRSLGCRSRKRSAGSREPVGPEYLARPPKPREFRDFATATSPRGGRSSSTVRGADPVADANFGGVSCRGSGAWG